MVGEVKVVVTVVVLVCLELSVVGRIKVDFSMVVTMLVRTVVLTLVTVLIAAVGVLPGENRS